MKNIIKFIIAIAIAFNLSSCLKDKDLIGPDADGAISNIIEFGNVSAPTTGVTSTIPGYSLAFDIAPTGTLELKVQSVGAEKATEDIKVSVALNNGLLAKFNEENEEHYEPLPSSQYALGSMEATIKKGERTAIIPIALKPDQFTFDKPYALGFTITSSSAGQISANFSNIVINIGAKNPYDGTYDYSTSAITSLAPNKKSTVKLVTVGPNRVKLSPGLLATYSNEVFYNIDPATMAVTVECPSLGVQTPQDTRSKYDPATKTLKVYWKQGNGGRTFEETFVYIGPR
ncbi:DUF1735 domain-containing protein [Sphingobacterium lactis]|uniref:DUF1735 domain-containing protein n=1 Tax=Sphingobacterium lactis TaxID=797291 RepID=UPI003DA4AA2E